MDALEKNLHKSMNKIYLYKHNFEEEVQEGSTEEDSVYDKTNSKIKIKCNKLFAEDEIASLPEEILKNWSGEAQPKSDPSQKYSRELCYNRFLHNKKQHGVASAEEYKIEIDDEQFGQ